LLSEGVRNDDEERDNHEEAGTGVKDYTMTSVRHRNILSIG
jgi:hypothetical protein